LAEIDTKENLMSKELLAAMAASVIEGEIEQAAALAHQALAAGMDPVEAIEHGYAEGIREVGEGFARGDYFLPHLAIGAEAMKEALAVLEPELARRQQERKTLGRVVIGTVAGDIHEVGKSLVGTMLAASGFTVTDLGVNVPAEQFVETVRRVNAQAVGLSALLTTTMLAQRDVIVALEKAGLRQQVKVMVGGAPVTEAWAREIGADGYAGDAVAAVALAQSLMGARG
jgi:corrinoid protein of di/trimethylamine methyltransferase